jgi:hypothetical protein
MVHLPNCETDPHFVPTQQFLRKKPQLRANTGKHPEKVRPMMQNIQVVIVFSKGFGKALK